MRLLGIIAAALVLTNLVGAGHAEEEKAGTACTHTAVLGSDDEGLHAIYEGIRLGLEKAGLRRVCLEEAPPADTAAWDAFDRKWTQRGKDTPAGERPPIVFGLGDAAVEALRTRVTNLPRVFAVERLAVGGKPLRARPKTGKGQALVLAQVNAEDVGQAVRRMVGDRKPTVWLARGKITPARQQELRAFVAGADATLIETGTPDFVMHLRSANASFAEALAKARAWRVPLVSDDRARFGRGATVVFVSDHRQVGRTAANLARMLVAGAEKGPLVRRLTGTRVWVDLEAADRSGVEFPLGFLARADRLRPGVRRPAR